MLIDNNSTPVISVIVPFYNAEQHIAHCIESILSQTFKYFELVLVNDGSIDNSAKICYQYSQNDSRINYLEKENGGPGSARNLGIKEAKGEYVYFVDGDDWIEEDLLEVCWNVLKSERPDIIIFGYVVDHVNKEGKTISSNEFNQNKIIFEKKKNNIEISNTTIQILKLCCNKVFRKDFIEKNNLNYNEEISLSEDVIFNFQSFLYTDKLIFINKALYHYVNRETISLSKKFNKNSFEIHLKTHKVFSDFLNLWCVNEKNINAVLAMNLIKNIKNTINAMFSYKNDLLINDKIKYIKMMVSTNETRKFIDFYTPDDYKSKIYKHLIKYKLSKVIALTSYMLK